MTLQETQAATWRIIVGIAYGDTPPPVATEMTKAESDNLYRKIRAIRDAASNLGLNRAAIEEMGQYRLLSEVAKAHRKHDEPRKRLGWMVSASLADAIMSDNPSPDAEEPLVTRFYRLGLRTSDDMWTFIHSWFALESDETLQHHMAEFVPKRFKKVGAKR
jgi:hypothetical protein